MQDNTINITATQQTMDHFAKILESVDAFLREGKTEEALDLLLDAKEKLDPNTYQDLLILKNRFSIANIEKHKGLMDQREYLRECSNISSALLYISKQIHLPTLPPAIKSKKQGKVLYAIPNSMPLNLETKCIIRIAYDSESIWENISTQDHAKLEDIKVSQIMEVALIDRSGGTDFEVRTLNRTDQYLELDDYSEWIFFVKPIITGTRKLYLKISTVQKIDGESMKKEIVLERAVEVVASEQFMMTNLHWTDSQIVLSSQKELDHFIAFNFLTQSTLVRRTLIVLFFISLSAGMYALVQHLDWKQWLHPTPKRVATSTPIIKSMVPNDTLSTPPPKETPIPAVAVKTNRVKQAPKPLPMPNLPEKPILQAENNAIRNVTYSAKPPPVKVPSKKKFDISLSLMDQVVVKDTVKTGQSILVTLEFSGIKSKDLAVYNSAGKQLKPMAIDGGTFYFELPYSATPFKLSVHDMGAKISKAHEFKGNANSKWYVKRVLGSDSGVKVD